MSKLKKICAGLMFGATTLGVVAVAAAEPIKNAIVASAQECDHNGNHYEAKDGNAKEYWICCKCHQEFYSQPADGDWGDGNEHNSKYYVEDLEKFDYTIDDEGNVVIPELDDKDVDYEVDAENGEVIIHAVGDDERFNYDIDDEGNVVRESVKDEILEHLDSHDVDYEVDLENGDIIVNSVDGDERFNYEVENDGSITIKGVDNIYDFRQEGDSGKYDIDIPDGVDSVDLQDAFKNKNLGTVTIPASVTDIGTGEECMFYNVNDIDKVVYEGNGKDFLTNGLFEAMTEACWKTYKDHSSRTQPYQPTEIVLDGVSYFTSNKVMGDFLTLNGKSSAGYVFYYKDAVPSKMKNEKGKSYSIDLCGKDTKKLNAAFGRDNHATFINEANM